MTGIRYDVPMVPVTQINRSQAPKFPIVEDPRFSHLGIEISTKIVNQSALFCNKNPVRMFLFNLISQNNWDNIYFEEVFRLCVVHIHIALNRSGMSGEATYEHSVDTILTLYSSELVFEFPELQKVINNDLLQASYHNRGLLNEIRMEMNRMMSPPQQFNHFPQQQFMSNVQQLPPNVVFDPRSGQYVYAQPGFNYQPQPGHVTPPYFIHSHGQQMHPQHQPMGRMQMIDPAPRPDPTITRDYSHRRAQPVQVQHPEQFSSQRTVYDRNTVLPGFNSNNNNAYEPDVIRSHQEVNTDAVKQSKGEESVERVKHEHEVRSIGTPSVREREQIITDDSDDIDIVTISTIVADLSLTTAIAQFRADVIKSPASAVCRSNMYIPETLISTMPVQPNIDIWVNRSDLKTISLNLREVIRKLSAEQDGGIGMLSLIRDFDYKMTKKVNEFLSDILEATFSIESFIDDYEFLQHHVLKTIGAVGVQLLTRFDNKFVAAFKDKDVDAANKIVNESILEDKMIVLPAGVHIGYIPSIYSVTVIQMDRVDLMLPITKKKFVLDPVQQKVAYNSIKDLFLDNVPTNVFESTIAQCILITKDGVKYKVNKTFNKQEYYVKTF